MVFGREWEKVRLNNFILDIYFLIGELILGEFGGEIWMVVICGFIFVELIWSGFGIVEGDVVVILML